MASADLILSFGRSPIVLSNAGMAEYEGYRDFYKPIVVTCMYVFSIGEWTSVWIKVRFYPKTHHFKVSNTRDSTE